MRISTQFDRRRFLQATGLAALGGTLVACAEDEGIGAGGPEPTQPAPTGTFQEPASPLSGSLSILMWSHFVPAHDTWFDPWVQEWGQRVGVQVTVDHINYAELPARTQAEIQAKQGHDLIPPAVATVGSKTGVLASTSPRAPRAVNSSRSTSWMAPARSR
jgi:multiple sugar transport system substrate-binding protein